jgi:hypothetical protein
MPSAIDPNYYVEALNSKGLVQDILKRHQKDITWFDKALAIDHNNVLARDNKDAVLDALGYQE